MIPDRIPYNPLLHLVESHVSVYKIYVLKNPLKDDEIFYVGQTVKSLAERLYGHLYGSGDSNEYKMAYIKDILYKGGKPIIEEVESIHTKCYIDKMSVNEREMYWINHFRSIGCKLLNIASPKNNEYRDYLSSIKKGETKWHYYYCGKTVGGISVYDEQKIVADGFRFSINYKPIVETYNADNNKPYHVSRFFKKLQRGGLYETEYHDDTVFNDCNPDYYDNDY